MTKLIILFATLAIALPFGIGGPHFGTAASQRFLERPTSKGKVEYTIPRQAVEGDTLTANNLSTWVESNASFAKGYALQIVPLDIAYLVCLGMFLAFASIALRGLTQWPPFLASAPSWVFWLLPGVYVISDLSEDLLIVLMLTWPSAIEGLAFKALSVVRGVKLASVGLAFVQVLLLCAASFIWPAAAKP